MADNTQNTESTGSDMAAADAANGEPGALEDTTGKPHGDEHSDDSDDVEDEETDAGVVPAPEIAPDRMD